MLAAVVVGLLSVAFAGCGGGDGVVDDGLDELEFVDEPTPSVGPVEQVDVIGQFLQEMVLLLPDMEYLDTQAFYIEELQEVARDIISHIEGGEGDEAGLEWVVSVHRTVLEWDGLQSLLAQQEVSFEHRDRYGVIYVGMIESYYRIAFAADRLLGAAVILGPTGRTSGELSLEERRRYRVLMNQAGVLREDCGRKGRGD